MGGGVTTVLTPETLERFCEALKEVGGSTYSIWIIGMIISIIGGIIAWISVLIMLYHFCYNTKSIVNLGKCIRFINLSLLIVLAGATILNPFMVGACIGFSKESHYGLLVGFWLLYFLGNYNIYILYAGRLYWTFLNTSFALSVWQIRFLIMPFVTFWICLFFMLILQWEGNRRSYIVAGLNLVIYIISFSLLGWLFIQRLAILATERARSILIQSNAPSNSTRDASTTPTIATVTPPTTISPTIIPPTTIPPTTTTTTTTTKPTSYPPIPLNEEQLKLIYIMSKSCILLYSWLLASIIIVVSFWYLFYSGIKYVIPAMGLFNISLCVALWSLYLQQPFADHHYRICCHYCEAFVQRQFEKKVNNMTNSRTGTVEGMLAEIALETKTTKPIKQ